MLILTFCLITISIYLIYIINNLPELKINSLEHKIKIYDTNDNLINTNSYFNTYVSYNKISSNVINALIATEDNEFFKHNGVDFKGIFRATFRNIRALSFKEGASTINQQLIKNTVLSADKTINRKITEMILALKLDYYYTKEQILELYLNNILFGNNIYGIYDASLYYFNKTSLNLSTDEAAALVGIIQLPNFYNPYINPSKCVERRNTVLSLMKKNGFINEEKLNYYSNINLEEKLSKNEKFKSTPYINSYLDYLSGNELLSSSNKIYTYLNPTIQKELYKIASDEYKLFNDENLETAMVVLDNTTGGILAMVGNRSSDKKVINYATLKRQMASTMKPIVDYGLAFEYLNLSPASLIVDEEYTYSDKTPLKNWDNQYKGLITLRHALKESRNIPALKLYQEIDNDTRISFMNKLGLYPDKTMYESEALGSGENTYSLLEICNAYLAFANEGKFIKANQIKKAYGKTNYQNDSIKRVAMKKSTAFFINSILHEVFSSSTYNLENAYMCAKTGQTNFDQETLDKYSIPFGSTKDSYVISYTKNITFGVWVGYDKVSSSCYLDRYKTQIPRNIMKIVMNKFAKGSQYEKPSNVVLKKVGIYENKLFLDDLGFYDYFIIGYEPKNIYEKKKYYEV